MIQELKFSINLEFIGKHNTHSCNDIVCDSNTLVGYGDTVKIINL